MKTLPISATSWARQSGLPMFIAVLAITAPCHAAEYVAIGRVIIGATNVNADPARAAATVNVQSPEFYGTQIEILESAELRRRAQDRVRALHPELKEIEVKTKVTQTKGSSILNVAVTGEEPNYTKVYCNALLDEYIAFRKKLVEDSVGSAVTKVIQEVLSREKLAEQKKDKYLDFVDKAGLELLEMERTRLLKRISAQRDEVDDLERKQPGGKELKEAQDNLAKTEKSYREAAAKVNQGQRLKEDYERTEKDLNDWKQTLDRLDTTHAILADPVNIMERPQISVEKK